MSETVSEMATVTIDLKDNTEGILPAVPMPLPFAYQSSARNEISQSATEAAPSVPLGFPASYSKPRSGGKYIARKDMNGMLHLATVNHARMQNGGVNTFNANLVSLTGGYAKGAVLDWWDDASKMVKSVISLVDNNTVNFTENGPDGLYWKVCSPHSCFISYDKEYSQVIGKFANLELPSSYGWIGGVIEMPFDGYVVCHDLTVHCTTSLKIPFTENFSWKTTVELKAESSEEGAEKYGVVSVKVCDATIVSPDIVMAKGFEKQRHEIFLAVCSDGEYEPYVDMENIGSGDTNSLIHMVSSSGRDGGGAPGPILVKKGSMLRLFGRQGYSESNDTDGIPSASIASAGVVNPQVSRSGRLVASLRVTAYKI